MSVDVTGGRVQEESHATLVEVQLEAHRVTPMLKERAPLGDCTNKWREGPQCEVWVLKNASKGQ